MKVLIVMGSDSDYPVVSECMKVLTQFGVAYECRVVSAHRTPDEALKLAETAEENGFAVIVAAAGKAAHLGGVMASKTILPVVGIPILSNTLGGMDALYSIVQMPPGVPVASMAIDGALNAGIFAVQIIASSSQDASLREKLRQYKLDMAEKVRQKDTKLGELLKREE